MTFLGECAGCKKVKLIVKRRSYIFPKVSSKPITSDGELCGQCFQAIKKMVQ